MTDTMRKLFIEILFIGKAKERKKKKKKSIIGRFWLEEVINDVLCIYIYLEIWMQRCKRLYIKYT